MRLEEMVLRIPGDEFRMRFHKHLTVLCGLGVLERHAMADSVINALTGQADMTVLTWVDQNGLRVEQVSNGGRCAARYVHDERPAPLVVGGLVPDADTLRPLVLLRSDDLGGPAHRPRPDEPPELTEARITLEALAEELEATVAARRAFEQLAEELADVDSRLRQAGESVARRAYAMVLVELEKVRAEAVAVQSGHLGSDNDRHLIECGDEARALTARWKEAVTRLTKARSRFGSTGPLDHQTLQQVSRYPAQRPVELNRLLAAWEDARRQRTHLEDRARRLATSRLSEPSDPRVLELATIDQNVLWAARQRVLDAVAELESEEIALGGIGIDDRGSNSRAAEILADVEEAHAEVEAAEASLGGKMGLSARLRKAREREEQALAKVGASSYLSFHLRRVDATITPAARERHQVAQLEHRLAMVAWEELAPGVSIDDAAALEQEVRSYADAFGGMGGVAGELEVLRRELAERAEPAVTEARAAVIAACAPFGLEAATIETMDATLVGSLVDHQAELGRLARAQVKLEELEDEEDKARHRLDDLLRRLGFGDGELEARAGALDWAIQRAVSREQARTRARSREEVENDLRRLEAEARRMRRPEWASITVSEVDTMDVTQLEARRDELVAAMGANPAAQVDIDRLADRHAALERRVATLEGQLGEADVDTVLAELAEVNKALLGHLARADHGGTGEPLPVILDEPFLRVPADRKWELLDTLRRVGEKTQLIYLTDDPFVGAWARSQASGGLLTLLEPVEERVQQ